MVRRAARKDANHEEIAEVFKTFGFSVADTSQLGNGFPDMVVGWLSANLLVEVKDGSKPLSRRRLSEEEQAFHDRWLGPILVVETETQALEIARTLKEEICRENEPDPK